jgi:cytochrome c
VEPQIERTPAAVGWFAMTGRAVCVMLTTAIVCGIIGQVFLAGLAALVDPGYWPSHALAGHMLGPLTMLLVLVSLLSRLRWAQYGLVAALLVLYYAQYIFLHALPTFGVPEARALHAVNALSMFLVALALFRGVWRGLRATWRTPTSVLAICGTALIASVVGFALRDTPDRVSSANSGVPQVLPAGDRAAGAQIFAQRCAVCHAIDGTQKVGPGLAGLFAPGGPALPAGIDYAGKLPNGEPITDQSVANWIVQGGRGQLGVMPGVQLNAQELADLIAYLRTLEG